MTAHKMPIAFCPGLFYCLNHTRLKPKTPPGGMVQSIPPSRVDEQLIADLSFHLARTFPSQISDKEKLVCAHPDDVLQFIESCTFETVERSYGKIHFFKDHIRCVFRSTGPHSRPCFGQTAPDFVRLFSVGKAPQKERRSVCQCARF